MTVSWLNDAQREYIFPTQCLACIALPTGAILIALSRVNSLLSCLRKPHLYENVGYGDERGGDELLEDERNDHDEDQGGEIQG